MKIFLFYTIEGYTYDKSYKETNNMQILGHGEGLDVKEAFENFKIHQPYIHKQNYKNILAIETIGDVVRLEI